MAIFFNWKTVQLKKFGYFSQLEVLSIKKNWHFLQLKKACFYNKRFDLQRVKFNWVSNIWISGIKCLETNSTNLTRFQKQFLKFFSFIIIMLRDLPVGLVGLTGCFLTYLCQEQMNNDVQPNRWVLTIDKVHFRYRSTKQLAACNR